MNQKYILQPFPSVPLHSRLLAKMIDLFIALILLLLFQPLGAILSVFYLSFSDHIQQGRSVGKKFLGFRVISLKDGSPCSLRQSVYRNLPFTVPLVFAIIPFWGWVFALITLAPLGLLELYLMFSLDSGHRLGDVMADTRIVIDGGEKDAPASHSASPKSKSSASSKSTHFKIKR